MNKKLMASATATTAALGMAAVGLAAAPASAAPTSLATVLTSDKNTFDKNSHDFDVVTEAVLAVLAAKPGSAVGVLADPSVKLTAFVPTDAAFLKLASNLTGSKVKSEKKAFGIVAGPSTGGTGTGTKVTTGTSRTTSGGLVIEKND